jgi:drug/metabolite transporter (DMT)-like permease
MAFLAMFGAVFLFGANFVVSRYAALRGMTADDLAALRFGVAAPLVLPLFLRRGAATCAGIGWRKGLLLVLTSGFPVTLLMLTGLTFAPAAHGATIGPGTVTAVGVISGIVLTRVLPPALTRLGLLLALFGLASVALAGSVSGSSSVVLGDLCFFAMGGLWGLYPILLQRWRVDAMTGAAICVVLSLPYVAFHLLAGRSRLLEADPVLVLVQAVFQGPLSMLAGLWLWGSAVGVLGAARTQLFPPMIPVIGTLLAIPTLGEVPGPLQSLGIALIVAGLALAAYGSRAPAQAAKM